MYTTAMPQVIASKDVFYAIADPTRRELLDRLRSGEQAATQLCEGLPLSQPALSKHLKVLRRADLVSYQRQGRQRLYRLNPEPLEDVVDWIAHYERFWPQKLDRLGGYLKRLR